MTVSVIIPAHNEATVIARGLEAILRGAEPGELEIIVVCNGCTDRTPEIARRVEGVTVLETPAPSKTNALNAGDAAAAHFPRFYVDADIVLSIDAIRQVARVLEDGAVLAAAPQAEFDLRDRPWPIRAYYQLWSVLPRARQDMIGAGVYALSRAGRERFGQFPAIIADDAFVRLQFRPSERAVVSNCHSLVTPPRTLGRLVAIKTRSHLGNRELRRLYPELWRHELPPQRQGLRALARQPRWWPALGVYLLVLVATRLRVLWKQCFGGGPQWERDETSRQPALPPSEGAAPPESPAKTAIDAERA